MREELLNEYAEEALRTGPHRFIRPDDKVFYVDGFKDGYNLGLKAKINMTTISDAPALPEDEDDYKVSIAKEAWDAVNTCIPCHSESFVRGYIAGAGAKRDQIKILGDRCNQLLKDKGELTDKVKELEEKLANADYQLEGRDNEIRELKAALKDKKCNCMTYLTFKDLEDELDRANKLMQRVIEWSEWQGSGCPRFNDIKDDIKAFLEEAHHD